MHKLLALALTLPALACSVGDDDGAPGQPDAGSTVDAPPAGLQVSGTLTASASWSGVVDVVDDTTIAAGATIAVAPGTLLRIAGGARVLVRGALELGGTSAGKITIGAPTAGGFHGGPYADGGGRLTMTYVVLTGGGVHLGTGGTATITDSRMAHVQGDLLTMNGGTLVMDYSQVGLDSGTDTTHCQLHFDGSNSIRITHSNIGTAAYGLMFYGGTSAVFTNDNWYGNSEFSVHTVSPVGGQPGVSGDFTGSWFDDNKVVRAAGTSLTGVVRDPARPRNTACPRP